MVDPKANKNPQAKVAVGPPQVPGDTAMISSPDLIRSRAYELYETRGREPGQDQQDWLRAEKEIRK